ncbi:hypothetical protein TrLO_g12039 [Triparma laevis f. longispina]|uniref:Uncharacterized protein n=1 Tax=Triparma laevis f. longispina TaxID=1714387 RepID=A0A9W7ECI2_9STRA|nr:hypothetical protein TrLO_g12039 [Triparma laevis f. longispina]
MSTPWRLSPLRNSNSIKTSLTSIVRATCYARHSEPVEQIFKGLGLELPSMLFRYSKSGQTLPDDIGLRPNDELGGEDVDVDDSKYKLIYKDATDDEKSFFKLMMDSQLTAFCSILGAACSEVNAYYILGKCRVTNEFCGKLLDNLPNEGVGVGVCEMFPSKGYDPYCSWWMSDEVKKAIREYSVPLEEEVQHTVKWASMLIPTLKYVVMFEQDKEKHEFLNDLARVVPVGVLGAAGMAKGEKHLKTLVSSTLESGRPLFIFKNTLCNGHFYSSLIEDYEEREKRRVEGGESEKDLKERLFPDGKGFEEDPPQVGFLKNERSACWAERHSFKKFNRDATMVIDPLNLPDEHDLVEEIATVMSSIWVSKPANSGEQNVEDTVIEDAVEMLEQLKHLEKNEKKRAWGIKAITLLLGFLTTSAAVIYEEFMVNYDSFAKNELKAITIILPVVLGVFLTIGQTWESIKRWSILKLTAAKVEREICRYECRVGEYRALVGDKPVHRANFTGKINQIWSRIEQNDLARQSLVGTKLSRGRKKVNEDGLLGLKSPLKKNIGLWKDRDQARRKMLDKKKKKNKTKAGGDGGLVGFVKKRAEKLSENHSISSEDYIRGRLEVELERLAKRLPKFSFQNRSLQILLVMLSASTAIMAAYELQRWIPVVLALVAMVEGFVEFRQLPLRLSMANMTYTRMKRTKVWWNGLSVLQKKLPNNKNRLIEDVEDTIFTQISVVNNQTIFEEAEKRQDENAGGSWNMFAPGRVRSPKSRKGCDRCGGDIGRLISGDGDKVELRKENAGLTTPSSREHHNNL